MTRFYHNSKLPCRFISVFNTKSLNIIRLMLFAVMGYIVTSCEEGPTAIGTEMLPESDFVNVKAIDTLSLFSYTNYDGSIRTDNPSVSYVGQIYDPYFGTTTADFVTQIRMGSPWYNQPYIIDSVKLFLKLLEVKGNTSQVHYLKLSEISEQIYTDSAYLSDRKVPLTEYEIPDIELPALRTDTINSIQLTLPVSFGYYLIRDTSMLFHSNTKPDFRSYFKGLLFTMSSFTDPLLVSLSLAQPATLGDSYNYIVLYMHDEAGTVGEFYFILDALNRNASFNRFSYNYSTAIYGDKMIHKNTTYKDTLSYLQDLNGVYTKISLPGLENLKNDHSFGQVGVNKARLTVPVYLDGKIYKASTAPTQLYLRYKTSNGSRFVVPDFNVDSNHSFFGGSLDTTALIYTFNIPAFVQGYLDDATGNIQPELEIFQGSGTQNVILRANNNRIPPKFQFTYTKF